MRGTLAFFGTLCIASAALAACGGGAGGAAPPVSGNGPSAAGRVATSIVVSFAQPVNAVAGLAQSFPLSVVVKDQNGAVMQGTYPQPILLTDSDTHGATSLSATSIASSTQSVSLNYTGAHVPAAITISASAPGVTAANVTALTFDVNDAHSYVAGDTYLYTRTEYSSQTQYGMTSQGQETDEVTVAVQTAPATFNGHGGLTDVITSFTTSDGAVGYTNHDYYAYAAGSPALLQLYGSTLTLHYFDPTAPVTSTGVLTFAQPSVVDELPQNAGATWNPAQAYVETIDETDGSGPSAGTYTDKTLAAADGSFERAMESTGPNGVDYLQYEVNSDASYSLNLATSGSAITPYSFTMSAGAPSGSGIPYHSQCSTGVLTLPAQPLLPITAATFPTPAPSTTPSPACIDTQGNRVNDVTIDASEPDWYPANPLPLDQEQYSVVETGVVPPSDCALPSAYAVPANHVRYTQRRLDPAYDTSNWTQDDYFAPGIGLVCSIQRQTLARYYGAFDYSGTPHVQIYDHIVYSLQPPSSPSPAGPQAMSVRTAHMLAAHFATPLAHGCAMLGVWRVNCKPPFGSSSSSARAATGRVRFRNRRFAAPFAAM